MRHILLILFFVINYVPFLYPQRDLETITSEEDLKQYIYQTAPSEDAFIALLRLVKPHIESKNWQKAIKILDKYKEWFVDMYVRIEKIIELLQAPEQNLVIQNYSSVNTEANEYFPVITIDGQKIYFTGCDREGGVGGEDIFYTKCEDGIWKQAKLLGKPFSTKGDDAVNSISADGNILILFGNYKGAIGGGDNFYSMKTATGWSEIKPFPKPLNTKYWECDGFLTADGKGFLFTSDRPGGVGEFHKGGIFYHGEYEGNTDIYFSQKTDSGWSNPVNLGPIINTPYCERSPFLHPDGKTLYFSSDGHYGLGSLDVFRSVRLSDTSWTDWSEPVNLGKEINTTGFDVAYKITTDGKLAYFSSNRAEGFGGYDIYSVNLPPEVKPEKNVITIRGNVTDENNKPLEATIKWYELQINKNIGILNSDPETGEYIITLPVGKLYSYFAEKEGYYSVSNSVDLVNETLHKEMRLDIQLNSIPSLKDISIKLNNIYFDFDRYELKPESFTEMQRVYKFLTDNPSVKIEISAHTDSQGSDDYNLTLSQKRAQSVVDYLIGLGIDSQRLVAKGYGEMKPVADNQTEEGRAMNRRVEMMVIEN